MVLGTTLLLTDQTYHFVLVTNRLLNYMHQNRNLSYLRRQDCTGHRLISRLACYGT